MRKRKPDGNIQVSTSSGLHHSCLISKPVQQKKKKSAPLLPFYSLL